MPVVINAFEVLPDPQPSPSERGSAEAPRSSEWEESRLGQRVTPHDIEVILRTLRARLARVRVY